MSWVSLVVVCMVESNPGPGSVNQPESGRPVSLGVAGRPALSTRVSEVGVGEVRFEELDPVVNPDEVAGCVLDDSDDSEDSWTCSPSEEEEQPTKNTAHSG